MNTFLTTLKGKIIAGVSTLGVIGGIIAAVVILTSGYRTIAIEALNGTTSITNNGKVSEAYVGQHLKAEDDVLVAPASDLTLALDNDKYVFAEENTHFWIKAVGKAGDTRTTIHMDAGSTLNRIDNKLVDGEFYEVETPNATMSVRGTVFRVTVKKDASGEIFTYVDVFEGDVFVQVKMHSGANTDESRMLHAGESAVIHSTDGFSEFLKGASNEIDYHAIPQNAARFLGLCIDSGRVLSIGKELLFDYVALIEHRFVVERDSDTGKEHEICEVCGLERETDEEEAEGEHDFEWADEPAEKCDEEGKRVYKCKNCGEIEDEEVIPAGEHSFGEWVIIKQPTCTIDGLKERTCEKCDEVEQEVIKALGHKFGDPVYVPANPPEPAKKVKICERCGEEEIVPEGAGVDKPHIGSSSPVVIIPAKTPSTSTGGNSDSSDDGSGKKKKKSSDGGTKKKSSGSSSSKGSGSSSNNTKSSSSSNASGSSSSSKDSASSSGNTKSSSSSSASSSSSSSTSSSSSSSSTTSSSSSSSKETSSSSSDADPCALNGHKYVEATVTEATCTTDGTKSLTCSVCGESGGNTAIPATGHSFGQYSSVDSGTHQRTCSKCGDTESAAHNISSWTYNPDYERHEGSCADCGADAEEQCSFDTLVNYDSGYHRYKCDVCGGEKESEHTMDPTGGECTVCGWHRV